MTTANTSINVATTISGSRSISARLNVYRICQAHEQEHDMFSYNAMNLRLEYEYEYELSYGTVLSSCYQIIEVSMPLVRLKCPVPETTRGRGRGARASPLL